MDVVTFHRVKTICLLLSATTLVLVALGSFVRATGAGLACPDWPLCFNRAIPDFMIRGVAQEWAHRVLASVVSITTFFLGYNFFKNRRRFPTIWKVFSLLLSLLLVQVILGGLTVIYKLNPFIVTAHLIVGTVFLQILAVVALEGRTNAKSLPKDVAKKNSKFLVFILGLVFFQMMLGGFVGSSGASLACPDIPLCGGEVIPLDSGPRFVQMLHRIMGLTIFILVLGYAIALTVRKNRYTLHAWTIVGLITAQIVVGFVNVYYMIPVSVTVLHLVIAELILLAVILLYIKSIGGTGFFRETTAETDFVENETLKRQVA